MWDFGLSSILLYALLGMLLCLDSYEQYHTQLLKVLHKCYNMDVLGILLIIISTLSPGIHTPLGVVHIYQSKPSLPCYNVFIYVCMYACNNIFGVKKVQPNEVESYLEVNAWTDWRRQDLISEYGQGKAFQILSSSICSCIHFWV